MVGKEGARRVSYHSFGPNSNEAYLRSLRQLLDTEAKRLGVRIDLHTTRGAAIGGKQYRSLHPLDIAQLTHSVWKSAAAGADAAVIGNIQDPGLYECRQLVNVPVVGLLEAAFAHVGPFGTRVGLLLTHHRTRDVIEEALRRYGLEGRLAGTTAIDVELGELVELRASNRIHQILNEVETGVARLHKKGADIVIVGSGLLAVTLESAEEGRHLEELGLLNPIPIALAAATSAAHLHRSGIPISRLGPYEDPPPQVTTEYFNRLDNEAGTEDR